MDHLNQSNPLEPASDSDHKANKAELGTSGNQPTPPNTEETKKLTKEEQMAKFEEAMKNEDWGHQPC
jgi:hypothetical protein